MKETKTLEGRWALILGASSGFGAATARALAGAGMHIIGVHLDSRATLPKAEQVMADVKAAGSEAAFFNVNAADGHKREQTITSIKDRLDGSPIHFVLHSLAFGALKPFIATDPHEVIDEAQMEMTLNVMAHSLVYWVQGLFRQGLLVRGSRAYALSSAGAERVVVPYGAVSAAKAALESHVRQLALELGPHGIAVNCLRPGVAVTPASQIIPGFDRWSQEALERNPGGRLTTPEDVSSVLVALADPAVTWISGATIPVDGGEICVG